MQIDKSKGYKSIYRSICIRLILISLAVEIGDKKQLKNMYLDTHEETANQVCYAKWRSFTTTANIVARAKVARHTRPCKIPIGIWIALTARPWSYQTASLIPTRYCNTNKR